MTPVHTVIRSVPGYFSGRAALMLGLWGLVCLLTACHEPTAGVSIVGYNHTTNRSIYSFTVDGRMGSNLDPESGGGKFSCCTPLPKNWRPGIKVKVRWRYQAFFDHPAPTPRGWEAEVDVPEYRPSEMDELNVHFYPDHQVKVVVSNMTIRHPDYPAALKWDAPTPRNAAVGRGLPEPPPPVDYEELITRSYRKASAPVAAPPPAASPLQRDPA
ncbi:MAG: DUF3304 domain-containing protein, partial [Burkholderiales bacterium]